MRNLIRRPIFFTALAQGVLSFPTSISRFLKYQLKPGFYTPRTEPRAMFSGSFSIYYYIISSDVITNLTRHRPSSSGRLCLAAPPGSGVDCQPPAVTRCCRRPLCSSLPPRLVRRPAVRRRQPYC
jgi:hypothetical protein